MQVAVRLEFDHFCMALQLLQPALVPGKVQHGSRQGGRLVGGGRACYTQGHASNGGLNFFITESGFETVFWLGPLGPAPTVLGSYTPKTSAMS